MYSWLTRFVNQIRICNNILYIVVVVVYKYLLHLKYYVIKKHYIEY